MRWLQLGVLTSLLLLQSSCDRICTEFDLQCTGARLRECSNARSGKRTGAALTHFSEGKGNLAAMGRFANDVEEGEWKYWYENGKPACIGQMKRGKRSGLWR